MSSPPPGGPQNPPSPPQYPQQPYPPQYPPQQPYYAQPATPPPKKSNTALIIVVVVVVVLVVLVAVAWWAITSFLQPVNNAQVTVTGVSFTIAYPGAVEYFGASPLTSCSTCPMHATLLQQITYTLSLTNSDSVAHNVTDVSLTGFQFTLVSAVPDPTTSSPVAFAAGASHNIVLTIQWTSLSGSNTLTGIVTTT